MKLLWSLDKLLTVLLEKASLAISKGKNRRFAWIKPMPAGEGDMRVGRAKGKREAQVGGGGGQLKQGGGSKLRQKNFL